MKGKSFFEEEKELLGIVIVSETIAFNSSLFVYGVYESMGQLSIEYYTSIS